MCDTVCQPVGCPACDFTGYKGRIGIYELLVFEQRIRDAIQTSARPEDMRNAIPSAGSGQALAAHGAR